MTSNQLQYHNLKETQKHNRADEAIRSRTNDINYELGKRNATVAERNAFTNERTATEQIRTHKANENLGYLNYSATASELPAKYLSAYGAYLRGISGMDQAQAALQNAATNAGMLVETNRTNLVNESIKQQQQDEYERNNIRQFNLDNLKAVSNYDVQKTNADTRQNELNEQNRHNVVSETENKRKNLVDQMLETTKQQQTIQRDKYDFISKMMSGINNNVGNLQKVGGIK